MFWIASPFAIPASYGIVARTAAASPFGSIAAIIAASATGIVRGIVSQTITIREVEADCESGPKVENRHVREVDRDADVDKKERF